MRLVLLTMVTPACLVSARPQFTPIGSVTSSRPTGSGTVEIFAPDLTEEPTPDAIHPAARLGPGGCGIVERFVP
jgi:hypothetical protein